MGRHSHAFDRTSRTMPRRRNQVALIDSGVATGHKQLAGIDHGIDIRGGEAKDPGRRTRRPWHAMRGHYQCRCGQYPRHPRLCAGRGAACVQASSRCALQRSRRRARLLPAARDRRCLPWVRLRAGLGHRRATHRRGKTAGHRLIAAAGNSAGAVLFPACSQHVMAVGAIGQLGSFPDDSPQAAQAAAAVRSPAGCLCRRSPVADPNSIYARPG